MTNKGTIIYVGGFELPDKNAAAHRVLSNAKIFRALGYRVVLMDSCREQNTEIEQKAICLGFERCSVRKSNKQIYSAKKMLQYIDTLDEVVAIVAYNYPAIALNSLRRYCRSKNIRLIADVTEWYSVKGASLPYQVIKGMDSYLRMCVLQPRLDGVIAISRYLENYYKETTNTVFIPPLTDLSEEKWQQKTERAEDGKLSILYAGSPGRNKDKLNLILRALQGCDAGRFRFTIIGITEEQYLTYYPEDAALLKSLSQSVSFLGRKTHTEVIRELAASDFSLFYREITRVTTAGFPTKFAEAITCGTPVLTNKTSDLAEYLVEGQNGYWIDDIETDLPRIINMDIEETKRVKRRVERSVFDYKNYTADMERFFQKL